MKTVLAALLAYLGPSPNSLPGLLNRNELRRSIRVAWAATIAAGLVLMGLHFVNGLRVVDAWPMNLLFAVALVIQAVEQDRRLKHGSGSVMPTSFKVGLDLREVFAQIQTYRGTVVADAPEGVDLSDAAIPNIADVAPTVPAGDGRLKPRFERHSRA